VYLFGRNLVEFVCLNGEQNSKSCGFSTVVDFSILVFHDPPDWISKLTCIPLSYFLINPIMDLSRNNYF
jgi:hypothetical protein